MRRAATPYLALLLIALVVTPSSAYGSLKQPSAVGVLRAQNNKLAQQNMIFRCGNEAAKQSMTQYACTIKNNEMTGRGRLLFGVAGAFCKAARAAACRAARAAV